MPLVQHHHAKPGEFELLERLVCAGREVRSLVDLAGDDAGDRLHVRSQVGIDTGHPETLVHGRDRDGDDEQHGNDDEPVADGDPRADRQMPVRARSDSKIDFVDGVVGGQHVARAAARP